MVKAAKINISGIVQGVGFRPFIYNLAVRYNLKGYCLNTTRGVEVVVEGKEKNILKFYKDIEKYSPPLSVIDAKKIEFIKLTNFKEFKILKSRKEKEELVVISPDISMCDECRKELLDPQDRRYLYPFINCVNCGPRFTIVFDIPYDRENTTMHKFKMCEECKKEYNDYRNRRYHAEPNACFVCGPKVELYKVENSEIKKVNVKDPIEVARKLLVDGKIIAIKGLGGFHLACDATNSSVVKKLKERKKREKDKPLAIMVGNIEVCKKICNISKEEEELLLSPARPIVLVEKKNNPPVAQEVAPKNKYLGIMLPYTPLHFLLFNSKYSSSTSQLLLVMTSANTSEEPIVKDNEDAFKKLFGIVDYFLIHTRDIFSRCDDSVLRMINKKPTFIRRSRGYVPQPIKLNFKLKQILGVGAELKNTFCLTKKNYAFLSQHIGDLKNYETYKYFEHSIEQFKKFFRIKPEIIAYDMHPDYLSTKYAIDCKLSCNLQITSVQHHHAHSVSCMVENGIYDDVIGVSFDGTGYGDDGKIWGCEFLICNFKRYKRVAHLKYIKLPGGDVAVKNPYRTAISYLYNIYGEEILNIKITKKKITELFNIQDNELFAIVKMLSKNINSPYASSCGRLFDTVSSLLGICTKTNYEGQAAAELEMMATQFKNKYLKIKTYNYKIVDTVPIVIDADNIIKDIIDDMERKTNISTIAYKFHLTVANFTWEVCRRIREKTNIKKVVLSGGCFQNKILTEMIINLLTKDNFDVFTHKLVPPNDGGISLGQVVIANSLFL